MGPSHGDSSGVMHFWEQGAGGISGSWSPEVPSSSPGNRINRREGQGPRWVCPVSPVPRYGWAGPRAGTTRGPAWTLLPAASPASSRLPCNP